MAEGDTIHRTARRLNVGIAGEIVVDVAVPNPRSPLRRQTARLAKLQGDRLTGVEARGKHLLLHFGSGVAIHSHLGMHGSWRLGSRGFSLDPRGRSAWVILSTGEVEAAQFGGSHLAVRTGAELRSDRWLRRVGTDVLASEFDVSSGVQKLRAPPDRTLGEALLDQSRLAGVGNVFKSEACFAARVDPWCRVSDLSDDELERLLAVLRELMTVGLNRRRHRARVYRRAGQRCPRCGMPICSRGQGDANRSTYWCGACQG
jgi:endonuclease-8